MGPTLSLYRGYIARPEKTVGMLSNSLYCEARVLTPPGMAQGSSRPAGRVLTFAWSEAPQSMLLAVALDNATVIELRELRLYSTMTRRDDERRARNKI